jgi:hypothetical protein
MTDRIPASVRVSGPPNSNFLVGYPGISATLVSLSRLFIYRRHEAAFWWLFCLFTTKPLSPPRQLYQMGLCGACGVQVAQASQFLSGSPGPCVVAIQRTDFICAYVAENRRQSRDPTIAGLLRASSRIPGANMSPAKRNNTSGRQKSSQKASRHTEKRHDRCCG